LSDVLSLFSENFAFLAKTKILAFDAHFSVSPEYLVLGPDIILFRNPAEKLRRRKQVQNTMSAAQWGLHFIKTTEVIWTIAYP
jgi:hypothetical protein